VDTLLFGEVKWDENIRIKSVLNKIDYCIENFPGLHKKKVIKVVVVKKRNKYNKKNSEFIISPKDILHALK